MLIAVRTTNNAVKGMNPEGPWGARSAFFCVSYSVLRQEVGVISQR